jgi:hypothetical protein
VTYCCDIMKGELERTCNHHADRQDCADNVIHLSKDGTQWGIMIHDGGHSVYDINFCPWCGERLK